MPMQQSRRRFLTTLSMAGAAGLVRVPLAAMRDMDYPKPAGGRTDLLDLGRADSTLRDAAGFKVKEFGAPIDVLWLRLPRRESDPLPW